MKGLFGFGGPGAGFVVEEEEEEEAMEVRGASLVVLANRWCDVLPLKFDGLASVWQTCKLVLIPLIVLLDGGQRAYYRV